MAVPESSSPAPSARPHNDAGVGQLIQRFESLVREIEQGGDTVIVENGTSRIVDARQHMLESLTTALRHHKLQPQRDPSGRVSYVYIGAATA